MVCVTFTVPPLPLETVQLADENDDFGFNFASQHANTAAAEQPTTSGSVAILHSKFQVNFDPAILEIIMEVKYLERIGFQVPTMAKYIAMMEDIFTLNISALNQMLKKYYTTMDLLDEFEVHALDTVGRLTKQNYAKQTGADWKASMPPSSHVFT